MARSGATIDKFDWRELKLGEGARDRTGTIAAMCLSLRTHGLSVDASGTLSTFRVRGGKRQALVQGRKAAVPPQSGDPAT